MFTSALACSSWDSSSSGDESSSAGSAVSGRQDRQQLVANIDVGNEQNENQPQPDQLKSFVYPKLQLVEIDGSWYALNQTCLKIYQQLQRCGTADLMPVDVVPLSKLPDCVRKSLSASSEPEEKKKKKKSRPPPKSSPIHNRSCKNRSEVGGGGGGGSGHCNSTATTFQIYDIMSASGDASGAKEEAAGPTSPATTAPMRQTTAATTASSSVGESWWSRFSCRRQRPLPPRNRHEIVQKLMETSFSTVSPLTEPIITEAEENCCFACVVCQSSFSTRRLLQRHRERANHFGCAVCFKSFKNYSSWQDHCERMDHWSDDEDLEDDDDDDDDDDSDYDFFSSETGSEDLAFPGDA